jgi:hypothetical protein
MDETKVGPFETKSHAMRSFGQAISHRKAMPTSQREAGHAAGRREALQFLCVTKNVDQPGAYAWLARAVTDGRRLLVADNVPDREIEIWDNAYRIAFLLSTLKERNRGLL